MSRSEVRPGRGRAGRAVPLTFLVVLLLGGGMPGLPAADGPRGGRQTAPLSPPVPGSGFAPGWAASGPPRTFADQDLFNQIDGGAELFLEFGFVRLRLQSYGRGQSELTLNAYEMSGPSSALGVYLMKMGRETPFPEVRARNSSEDVQLTILKGRYFIQVDNLGEAAASRAETVALANAFLAGVAEEPAETPLHLLPDEGRVPGSERLIRGPYGLQPYFTFGEGDILSLGGRVFGALAEYRTPDGASFTRLIVPYPDAPAAAAAMAHLRANLDTYLKVLESNKEAFVFEDFRKKFGIVGRKGAVLDIRVNLDLRPGI